MTDEVKAGSHPIGNMPGKEVDIISVATVAGMAWRKSGLILIWTTPDKFETAIEAYSEAYKHRKTSRGDRQIITQNRAVANAEINTSVKYVKNYICDKFGVANASAYYARFGIVKNSRGVYSIPVDGDSRLQSLQLLIEALSEYGMQDLKYGKTYWNDLYIRYAQANVEAVASDSVTAQQVALKNELRAEIVTTLNSLIHLVRANYPRTWREQLRAWGFQKEKY